jgi:hypothetical protein
MHHNTCKNCEQEFESHYTYCPYCGQKSDENLTLGVLFYNTISNYFTFDARFFRSFIPLMIKPGYVAKRFVMGKRLMYLHPAQFYLFTSIVFFFLFSFVARQQQQVLDEKLKEGFKSFEEADSTAAVTAVDTFTLKQTFNQIDKQSGLKSLDPNDTKNIEALDSLIKTSAATGKKRRSSFNHKMDSLIANNAPEKEIYKEMGMEDDATAFDRKLYAQALKFYKKRGGGILQAFYDTIPISMFFLLPIFALILKLLNYKRGRFSHHLVFSFYFLSFLFMTFSVMLLVNFIWDIPVWIEVLVAMSTFFYLFLAMKHFYEQGYFKSFLKSSIATFLFFMFVLPTAAGFIALAAFMFY